MFQFSLIESPTSVHATHALLTQWDLQHTLLGIHFHIYCKEHTKTIQFPTEIFKPKEKKKNSKGR